jgi:hypothetical protein
MLDRLSCDPHQSLPISVLIYVELTGLLGAPALACSHEFGRLLADNACTLLNLDSDNVISLALLLSSVGLGTVTRYTRWKLPCNGRVLPSTLRARPSKFEDARESGNPRAL